MKYASAIVFTLLPLVSFGQTSASPSDEALIAVLGSKSYVAREKAMRTLMQRPEAQPALRAAMRTSDLETQTRIRAILEHLALTELNVAVKEGKAERVIQLLADWPPGKNEQAAWEAIRDLSSTLGALHAKTNSERSRELDFNWNHPGHVVSGKRVTEMTPLEGVDLLSPPSCYFVRAHDVDVNYARQRSSLRATLVETNHLVIVAAGSVSYVMGTPGQTVFAGKNAQVRGEISHSLIVSGGDLTIGCEDDEVSATNGVFIARGKITLHGFQCRARVICGESFVGNRKRNPSLIITENEPNPLGFIRWSNPPKAKTPAKSN